jgi:transposase
MSRRRTYTKEFKVEAVRLALKGDRSQGEVGRELGIPSSCLGRWMEKYQDDEQQAFPGKGRVRDDVEQLRKLERELRRVQEERDILKKALAIFSKEPR